MKYHDPLKKILSQASLYWDRDEMRAAVRRVFGKAMQCRTAELGAEVYSSENQELTLYHTCKSRACPSCGYRANVQWLRERWAALPDALYKGITFTMPNQLWPLFRDNPPLAKALSALAAEVIKARVSARYGLRVGVIAILHTFNGKLEFNSPCGRGADHVRSLALRSPPKGEVWGVAFAPAPEWQRWLPRFAGARAEQTAQSSEQRADRVPECVEPNGQ
jgi:hypothetical protein